MMTALADLHTHTTASDGQYTPTQVIELAKAAGIQMIAITDHDTIDGVTEAVEAGNTAGIRVVHGVELSAKEHHNFHLLGYGFRAGENALSLLCGQLRAGRDERKYKIINFLRQQGAYISEVEEMARGKVIARPHFAQTLVKRGYAKDNRDDFERYLNTSEFREKVTRLKADACTCVETIRDAGGKVSLAHPYQMGLPDDELETLVRQLKDWGLDAIECFYSKYTPAQRRFYIHLAGKYHLHQTGGSDFHGESVKPDIRLAKHELNLDWMCFRQN